MLSIHALRGEFATQDGDWLRRWATPALWPRMAAYGALATGLHVSLILLIIQRRELSDLDRLVFWYLLLHLAVDGIRLLLGIVILLCRGFPRLADLGPEDWPAVSVVIPCHNEAEVIAETIRSL